jgi:hypothetical protein
MKREAKLVAQVEFHGDDVFAIQTWRRQQEDARARLVPLARAIRELVRLGLDRDEPCKGGKQ